MYTAKQNARLQASVFRLVPWVWEVQERYESLGDEANGKWCVLLR